MTIETTIPPATDYQPTVMQEELPRVPLVDKPQRLVSLDIFRGITIAAMVLVNNSPDPKYVPLEHVAWHGWTPTDLIFPFFLFIVGVATPFSLAKRVAGDTRGTVLARIWTRALSLFVLGELLTGIPWVNLSPPPEGYSWITALRIAMWCYCCIGVVMLLIPWKSRKLTTWLAPFFFVSFYLIALAMHLILSHAHGLPENFTFGNGLLNPTRLRIPGVLQRIGICYGITATIALFFGWRMVLLFAVALMAIYSGLMLKAPFSNHTTGSLTQDDNLARRIDEWLLIRKGHWNHAYSYPDNEGLLSTLPSIATSLLGILAGLWLRTARPTAERCSGLLVFGLLTLLIGLGLNKWLMPINKNIWTPSFTVFTAGMALLCLGSVMYFVDIVGRRAWALPFKIYGMNAIAAFVVSGMVVRILSVIKIHDHKTSIWHYCEDAVANGVTHFSTAVHWNSFNTPQNASLVFGIGYIIFILLLMAILYVCKIFVKV